MDLNTLSLSQKIAQMLLVGFRGLEFDADSKLLKDIFEYGCGGVILFDKDVPSNQPVRNIKSPQQLQTLTQHLQERSTTPLLIAIDQEGGRVARLNPRTGFPRTPSHQSLGERDSLPHTRSRAMEIAGMLAVSGINFNFAPCVDVNLNPQNPVIAGLERSFSSDPQKVTEHAAEYIKAHHDFNVRCAIKHFPGHGSSRDDSHLGLVDITQTWQPVELDPYKQLISQGLVDAVMTAHVFHETFDSDYPATLSEHVIRGKLREELGFDGVVVSDDLQMRAISNYYEHETVLERAIRAGVDILLFANNSIYDQDIVETTVRTVERLVRNGKISEDRIDQSVQRIHQLKAKEYDTTRSTTD